MRRIGQRGSQQSLEAEKYRVPETQNYQFVQTVFPTLGA